MTPSGLAQLKRDEGLRTRAYPDPLSPLARACRLHGLKPEDYMRLPNWQAFNGDPWTEGYGHTGGVKPGDEESEAQAAAVLARDVANTETALAAHLPWFSSLNSVTQDVLVNIAFNVGVVGLLHWPQTLGHIAAGRLAQAANDLLNEGKWDDQVGDRAERLADALLNGRWTA